MDFSIEKGKEMIIIAQFQVEMAKETENLDLDFEKTKKEFFIFLITLVKDNIGSLCMMEK